MGRNDEFHASYRGSHEPHSGAPLHEMTGQGTIYPEDFYSSSGPQNYGGHSPSGKAAVRFAQGYRGKPDKPVTIYRAVPKGVTRINAGDWVAIHPSYAHQHGESNLNNDYTLLSKTVPAKHIINPGDSPEEFGYHPS